MEIVSISWLERLETGFTSRVTDNVDKLRVLHTPYKVHAVCQNKLHLRYLSQRVGSFCGREVYQAESFPYSRPHTILPARPETIQ